MNESELRRLLITKNMGRVPKLRPLPDLENLPLSNLVPAPSYHRDRQQKKYLRGLLEEKATRKKIIIAKPPLERCERDNWDPAQYRYIDKLRSYALESEPPPMLKTWERKIALLVPLKLRQTFPALFQKLLKESKEEWDENLKKLAVKTIIRDEPGVSRQRYQEPPFKFKGITASYKIMLRNRMRIKKTLLLLHPFIRLILETSELLFPPTAVDLASYRSFGPLTIENIMAQVEADIKKTDYLVSSTWYSRITSWAKTSRALRIVVMGQKNLSIFVTNAIKIISRQIQELMRNSMNFIIDNFSSFETVPILKLNLFFDGEFIYDPCLEDVYKTFHSVLDLIKGIGQKLLPLEYYVKLPFDYDAISVKYNEWLNNDCHERLQKNLEIVFQPLLNYLEELKDQYSMLYGEEAKNDVVTFVETSEGYEVCFDKINYFREISSAITGVIENSYFDIAHVNQAGMITGLKQRAGEFIDYIIAGVVAKHIAENEDICNEFETIAAKALKEPESAAELVEQGVYILYAKTVIVESLKLRIADQLSIITTLLEITVLTPEHVELNTRTVNWLSKIKPIFDRNASAFEAIKAEMEENLQNKIKELNAIVNGLIPKLEILDYMDDINHTFEYLEQLRKMTLILKDCDKRVAWINQEEAIFKFPITSYPDLEELKEYILPFHSLIYLIHKWRRSFFTWMDGPFEYMDHEQIEQDHEFYYKELLKLSKAYKNKIRQQITEETERRFKGFPDDPDVNNFPAPMKLCFDAISEIKEWRPNVNMAHIMCNPALRQRHWDEMSLIANFDLTPNAGTTLRKIIDFDLWEQIDQYEIISVGATKELALITNLNKMKAEWKDICFKTSPYKDTGINILSGLDDIQSVLDDHIVKTIGMRGSAFVKPFRAEVQAWWDKINRVNSTIDEWGKVQAQWLYLLPIFSSKDIVAQMPEEGTMFQEVNGIYRRYMGGVEKDPHVLDLAGGAGVLESFKQASVFLEKINEGVNNYLEKKRLYFPRFFFLSNDEMLEILSETKNPLKVQPHLKKCFEGVNKLSFDSSFNILAMISQEEEIVDFLDTISVEAARGSVEKWLVQVEEQMLKAVKSETELSYYEFPALDRPEWILSWEGMVVLAVSQIYWAVDIHNCLNTHKLSELKSFHNNLKTQLLQTVAIIRRSDLNMLQNITVKALIVIDVHAKDVVQDLIDKEVTEDTDFQWLAQLRYYWEDSSVTVKIINAVVSYRYEYLGNSDRLVITPLTDRCYRTLVGAYYLHLNGAPEGPAGTGKTETTKDLAKALAVQCVVFNCSDGLDYKAMGKFFKGLASCGAWICFDEFNRIEVEVLSVIAQQILCIIQAVRANVETFVFEGTTLILNPACYVCITMNPGYAGRSELPDNLKVLFRTVAMMVPDYAMIGEISLYSFGFSDARNLSIKIVTTYRLCSEQLSSQNHYDYGMRAVKTVLSAAGNLKRAFPDENESILLLRSIKDVNLAKFLSFDVPLFNGIISDLFPGIVLPVPDYVNLFNACTDVCEELNLQPLECFFTKIVQTFEMMIVRHGFMLVGDPFGGKSSTLKVLSLALTLMGERKQPSGCGVMYKVLNPKSVTMGQLFGAFDPISYEWTDGIVATTFRDFAQEDTPVRKWVVFDGPVDAVWIENMNTVLDDNKKLCLTSGEVIAMTNVMSMIFEVMDLSQASPATVSRCGMIYMESSSLGFQPFYKSWLKTLNPYWIEENEMFVYELCEWLFDPLMNFVRKHCSQLVSGGEVNRVVSTLRLIATFMDDAIEGEEDTRYTRSWILASFMISIVWGIGGLLNANSRERFDDLVKEYFRGERGIPHELDKHIDVSIPTDGMIIDHYYQYKHKGCWKPWADHVKAAPTKEKINLLQTVIPTMESEKYAFLLQLHVKFGLPFLLIGPTGTGKSFYIQDYLMNHLDMDKFLPGFISFTTTTSANQFQELVISKLFKVRKGIYGPGKGKRAVMFIDDMNMPAKEKYGAQPPIELLRLYFDQRYWFDLKTTEKLFILDTFFFAAIGPVGGSRQLIYPRLLRHFNMYSINEFAKESMVKIFTNLLQLGWRRNGFGQDAQPYIVNIISSTTETYDAAISGLRPTPAKSHYIFNLRDFSRVIQGCALLRKESVDSKKVFMRVWIHEIMRVFYDRLVDEQDRTWFFDKLKKITAEFMKDNFDAVLDTYQEENGQVSQESIKRLMFGTFLDVDSIEEERRYEEIPSKEVFFNVAIASLQEYNSMHKAKMNIVLFDYALEHLSKICRILSMPSGNALLVGVGGSGRQSLTKLASSLLGQNTYQPEITKSYSQKDWADDLKLVLKEAGGLAKSTTFLFTENQIKEELFIQNIDSLLNSGEVPNMYGMDEKQEIIELCRLGAQGGNRNLDVSPLQVFSFFIGRVKIKLHIVLCFSPIGSSFRTRLRLYPSLVNCCTIDWYDSWPEDALEMVAHFYMGKVNVSDTIKKSAVIACKQFHVDARKISASFAAQTGRKTYITSASYLNLIQCFTSWTNRKQRELKAARIRYTNGLDKLDQAAEAVGVMQLDLSALKPQLIVMAEKSAKMMEVIEKETIEADKAAAQVREDQKVANVQAAAAQELKKDCEADLALALPILEEAVAALNTLKPADITLVKSMKNPPAAVKLVMAAVCVMKGVPPDKIPDPANPGKKMFDFWGPSKRILGDMNFLDSLKNFDKDNIPVATMTKIRKEYLPNPEFKPNIIAKASTAAEGLCKWIIAMNSYDAVAKVVAPKKAKLNAAEKDFADTMAILEEKKATVARLEKKLAELNEALEEANQKKQDLEQMVQNCIDKLYRAEKLIGGLGGEKVRWTLAAENLQILYDNLAGDILASCGIIAYLGPYTLNVRVETIEKWCKLVVDLKMPHSDVFVLKDILGTDIKIQSWNIAGLPRDSFSTDNAIIQDCSMKWSLMIDPQGQANKWIKTMEKSNDIQIMKFSDDYMKIIETCLEYGKPALIENLVEDVEPPLDPVLLKNTFKQSGKEYIAIGDNVIEYHPLFRLYMTTKLRNPHYLPEVFNKVTVINFALTKDGLEDQLLGIVVAKERPDLQEKREKLIVEGAANRAALKKTEDDILRTLQETKGDILEDESAIEVLDSSKLLSVDIIKKQEASLETELVIETFRQGYRPVAFYSAVLYYCVTELPNVDPMYQYSLTWFINLYILSIENANKSKDLDKRLRYLKETFTYNLYSNVCRGIFDKDKLMFSFIMCSKIMLSVEEMNHAEFSFLISGGVAIENPHKKPTEWLPDRGWDELCRLDDLKTFRGIKKDFTNNTEQWRKVYDDVEPHLSSFPNKWQTELSAFQRLLVIRIIRPDKLTIAISLFVEKQMGQKFIIPPTFDLAKSFVDSNFLSPLIFILSPGSDPMGSLIKFCERMGYTNRFNSISLGQGQGPIARSYMEIAQSEGGWVCLQNCHLAVSWLPTLEKYVEGFDVTNTDISFRLWLTSYPSDCFPQSILQNGVKMTNEPPTGLQHNLNRSYLSEPLKEPEFYNGCPGKEKIFSKLLYGISFFHAVVQERKKFGPLGWNIQYGFNDSDFHISVMQLQMFLNQYEETQYVAIKYLTGECNYGGRVTDDWDRRLIVTVLDNFVNPEVAGNPNYLFSEMGQEYGLPRRCEYQDYLKHIENVPVNPPPEVYGLHLNAGITRDYNMSMSLMNSMCLVEGSGASTDGGNTEALLLQMASDILSKLPGRFDIEEAQKKYPVDYNESMNTVLVQEMERFNRLLNEVINSLKDIGKAVEGLIVMSPALELMANAMLTGRIPENWIKVSYPSLKPLPSYVTDLLERLEKLQSWFKKGKPPTFWIPGFFFTQAFLTGAMQNYARLKKIPIDLLVFDFEVRRVDYENTAAEHGVFVTGLFVDGARWDRSQFAIAEQYPKILNDHMPVVWLYPKLKKDFSEGSRYKCPLYKTLERKGVLATTGHSSNFVLAFYLPSNKPSSHWIKRSVALLLQLNN